MMLLGISLCASAQKGLCINKVFEGRLVEKELMQESLVKGENLVPYKLKVLHTVKFTANEKERAEVDSLFCEDMKERISDDDSNMELESRDGFIYYAIVELTDIKEGLHRYICYQCKGKSKYYDLTLVYMEGEATLSDLRKTFKKKKQ